MFSGSIRLSEILLKSFTFWLDSFNIHYLQLVACLLELDALGDELLLDEDSSYLDEASTAPEIPDGTPGQRTTNRVIS